MFHPELFFFFLNRLTGPASVPHGQSSCQAFEFPPGVSTGSGDGKIQDRRSRDGGGEQVVHDHGPHPRPQRRRVLPSGRRAALGPGVPGRLLAGGAGLARCRLRLGGRGPDPPWGRPFRRADGGVRGDRRCVLAVVRCSGQARDIRDGRRPVRQLGVECARDGLDVGNVLPRGQPASPGAVVQGRRSTSPPARRARPGRTVPADRVRW